jgi:hypothetical protein
MKLMLNSRSAFLAAMLTATPVFAGLIPIANSGFEDDAVADNEGQISPPSSWTFETYLAPSTSGSAYGYVGDKQWLNTVPPGLAPGLIPGAHSGDQYYVGHVVDNDNITFAILHQDTGLAWSSLSAGDTLTLSAWATYRADFPGSANTAMWLNFPDNVGAINSVLSPGSPGWFNVSSTGPAAGVWTELSWTYTVTQADIDAAANSWGSVNVAVGFQDTVNGSQVAFDDVSLEHTPVVTTGFNDWISDPDFGLLPGEQGLGADPDGDGIPNGVEGWFGTHPGEFNQELADLNTNGTTTTFSHPRNGTPLSDLSGSYRWSPNLVDWYAGDGVDGPPGGPTVSIIPVPAGAVSNVTATASAAVQRFFVRVGVVQD